MLYYLVVLTLPLDKITLRISSFYVCVFCPLRDYNLKSSPKYIIRTKNFRRIVPFKYDTCQVSTAGKKPHTNVRYGVGDSDTR